MTQSEFETLNRTKSSAWCLCGPIRRGPTQKCIRGGSGRWRDGRDHSSALYSHRGRYLISVRRRREGAKRPPTLSVWIEQWSVLQVSEARCHFADGTPRRQSKRGLHEAIQAGQGTHALVPLGFTREAPSPQVASQKYLSLQTNRSVSD